MSAYLLLPLFRISTILRCHKIRAHYFAPTNQFLFDSVARLFAVINCASNFIIYCMVGTQFRAELLLMVGYEVRSKISRIEVVWESFGKLMIGKAFILNPFAFEYYLTRPIWPPIYFPL